MRFRISSGLHLLLLGLLRFTCRQKKAERVGFEPTRRFNTAYAISSRAPSANSDTSPQNADRRVYQTEHRFSDTTERSGTRRTRTATPGMPFTYRLRQPARRRASTPPPRAAA